MCNVGILFVSNIKTEVNYIIFQVAKFILYFNGETFDDYISAKSHKINKNKIVFKQTTSVRSYFVIKMFLLTNLDGLINMMDESMLLSNERLLTFANLINDSKKIFIDLHNDDVVNNWIETLNINVNASSKEI